jgi:hypothetical protein
MEKTVVALYDDLDTAKDAVSDLVENGFVQENISLLARDDTGQYSVDLQRKDTQDLDEGVKPGDASHSAGVGASIGAAMGGIGGLLVGLGVLIIPGIGPAIAAGPMYSALAALTGAGIGAVVGGVTGGFLDILVNMGVPEDSANYYAEGVRRGGTLVAVRTGEHNASAAAEILNQHYPANREAQTNEWRQSGWTRFDPDAEPYQSVGSDTNHPETELTRAEDVDWPRAAYEHQHPEDRGESGVDDELVNHSENYEQDADIDAEVVAEFEAYEPAFRDHFAAGFYRDDYTYEQFRPAYYHGYLLARDERNRDRDWDEIALDAQRFWEERDPGSWDRYSEAIHYAWEGLKEQVR